MKKILIFLIFCICLTTVVTAQLIEIGPFKKGENITITQSCDNCTSNNITSLRAPGNFSLVLENLEMNSSDTMYTANCENCTNISGIFTLFGVGDLDGKNKVWAYTYKVNPQGIEATDQRTQSLSVAIYFIFGVAVLLFFAFLFVNMSVTIKLTFLIFSLIFILMGFNIIAVSVADEVVNPRLEKFFDNFTAIIWIFYWFAAGILIIIWGLTFFNTWFYQKNLRDMQRYG